MDILTFFKNLRYNSNNSSPYSIALKYKNGEPLKHFSLKNDYELLFDLDETIDNSKIITFLSYNKECLVIPLEFIDGNIFGFVFRSLTKKAFYNYKMIDELPMMYGINDFTDFEYGKPIFLTEGIKDCHTIKMYYKHCLAYLTSQPSEILFNYLTNITNNIIIIGDNDKTGKKLVLDKKLKEKYKYCNIYYLMCKDSGEYWEGKELVGEQVKNIVNLEITRWERQNAI